MRLHDGRDPMPGRIRAARAGDAEARAWLVERWQQPLFRFCRRMLSSDEDALDATQDTLVKMLRHLEQFDDKRNFSSWVFGIARNRCIDEHRRRKRRVYEEPGDLVDPGPSPIENTTRAQRADQLIDALGKLPPMYREVLVLYHFEHLKYAEISEALELPMGTVMNRIFRARRKLREAYEAQGGQR
ncbi:MAG: sigma-70 family RNA polymerase sigma factor [Proteobacteria bacterium]|nr:sigma-70 family RNA polymerase sigma factor [Pseudomonadota bacterium]